MTHKMMISTVTLLCVENDFLMARKVSDFFVFKNQNQRFLPTFKIYASLMF